MVSGRRRLSAVVPCYNEAAVLQTLHQRLSRACTAVVGDDYELVLVNDGSTDDTWKILRRLAAIDWHIVAIDLTRGLATNDTD